MPHTPEQLEARRRIVEVANNMRTAPGKYNMRQIQQCVHLVRKYGLVPLSVITAAGYREAK